MSISLLSVFAVLSAALGVLFLVAEFGHPSAEVEPLPLSLPIANLRIVQCRANYAYSALYKLYIPSVLATLYSASQFQHSSPAVGHL